MSCLYWNIAGFVAYYNERSLHSAVGYVPPVAVLEDRTPAIFELRRARLREGAASRGAHWSKIA